MKIYYIGGSPGSGKSTIARMIAKKYGGFHYRLDDHLFQYLKKGAKDRKPYSMHAQNLNREQTWMRDPVLQAEQEFSIYQEIFDYAFCDICKKSNQERKTVIAEGAGFTPEIMLRQCVSATNYICLLPTADFQRKVFAKRVWSKIFLMGCKDKQAAFENWMERDVLFAKEVLNQAKELNYPFIIVDGSKTIEQNYTEVSQLFFPSSSIEKR